MLKKALLATMLVFCTTGFCSNMHAADAASLTPKQENIVLVSAWTAQGNLPALKQAFNKALNDGVTVNELKEVSIQMYAYSGFPRSLNALNTLLTVIDERKTAGIKDAEGKTAAKPDPKRNRHSIGTAIQTELVGRPVAGRVYDFSPEIDRFLKEHLFCDIFERDVLNYQERELATVSALAALGNVNAQLASHYNVSLNVGLSTEQLEEAVKLLKYHVGSEVGNNADNVLRKVLHNKN